MGNASSIVGDTSAAMLHEMIEKYMTADRREIPESGAEEKR